MDEGKVFHHQHTLVGRQDLLEALDRFIQSDHGVFMLVGRGGVGKSKILFEFGKGYALRHHGWEVRFLREGMQLTQDALRELPVPPYIVVIDDAHRRSDLDVLCHLVQQYRGQVKLIMSCRPQGTDYLRVTLTRHGFDPTEIEVIQVNGLTRQDLEKIAREILGSDASSLLIEQLIEAAKDSPLVLTVGAHLVASKAIPPAMLVSDEDFQRLVLDRFQDEILGRINDRHANELCREVLKLISALSPVYPHTDTFKEKVAEFLRVDRSRLIDAVATLEKTGILLRRGRSLRITPDVLSDHILYKACVTPQGEATGYAEELFEAFGSLYPENLLFNLAELDWRMNREGRRLDLLADIWVRLENEFHSASCLKRCQMLDYLKRVAYYQPEKMLALVQYAINNPAVPSEDENQWSRLYRYTNDDVLHKLPPILRDIAFHPDYLPRCCDLLWQLGRDDSRPTNSHPDHAMRILADLASYDPYKPLEFNRAVVEVVARWLEAPDAHEHLHSPLDVLDPILAKEGYHHVAQGVTITISSFSVKLETTRALRERVIGLLEECTRSSPRVVLRALKSLCDALRPPLGLFGRQVPEEEKQRWIPERLRVLEIIGELARSTPNPVVQMKVVEDLWYVARDREPTIADRARDIIESIPGSLELRITRAMWGHSLTWWDDPEGYEERFNREQEDAAREFLGIYGTPENAFDALRNFLSRFGECGIQPQPGAFLYALGRENWPLASQVAELIVAEPSCPLAQYFNSLLLGIRGHNPAAASSVAMAAIETEHETLCLRVAAALAWRGWAAELSDDEVGFIQKLLVHPSKLVRAEAIGILGKFPSGKRGMAVSLALEVDIGDDEELANALCSVFEPKHGIPCEEIEDEHLIAVLAKLVNVRKLDEQTYYIDRFLGHCSTRIPDAVIELLLQRTGKADEVGAEFQPFPYEGFDTALKGIITSQNYKNLLRKVRDSVLECHGPGIFWVPILFRGISDNYGNASLEVLNEWLKSGDGQLIKAAAGLLRAAPNGFVFAHRDFVIKALDAAYSTSPEAYCSLSDALFFSAISGTRSGTVGEPMPQDVELLNLARRVSEELPKGSPACRFYDRLARHAEEAIRYEMARDEELCEE